MALEDDREMAMRALALELAKGIRDTDEILATFRISYDEYIKLAESRAFRKILDDAAKEWSDTTNTPERVKYKSLAMIEEVLPHMYKNMVDSAHPLSSRADLFGRIAKIAGVGEKANAPPGTGEGFSITINLGNASKPIVIQQDVLPRVSEGDNSGYEDL